MLFGRENERRRIERLLDRACAGEAGVLALVGEPGVGKTALLEHAREFGRRRGMQVLEARGAEDEANLQFAGLHALLRAVLDRLKALPARQRRALAAALAVGEAAPADALTVATATLALLDGLADESPLLVLLDDLHWLDPASASTLLFAARRLGGERIALLLATRDASASDLSAIERVDLGGLTVDAAADLLSAAAGAQVPRQVAEAIVRATAGNPLALAEAPAVLGREQLLAILPLDDPLPIGPASERLFSARIERLPSAARTVLLLAAANGTNELATVAAAATTLGTSLGALEQAERAGLIELTVDQVTFRHPLVRSAAYQQADPRERRAAHRALAGVLVGDDAPARRAWHLAAAALGPDAEAADALEDAAEEARARAGFGSAAAALERAARLSPDGTDRDGRLVAAAEDALAAGATGHCSALLDEVLTRASDPLTTARARHLSGRLHLLSGDVLASHRVLAAAAEDIADADPALATAIAHDGALPLFMAGRVELAVEATARVLVFGERAGGAERAAAAVLRCGALMISGSATDDELEPLMARHRELPGTAFLGGLPIISAAQFLTWRERYEEALALTDELLAAALATGALGVLPLALAARADIHHRTGDWTAARTESSEGMRLAQLVGHGAQTAFGLVLLARTEAAIGAAAECREHAGRAPELARAHGVDSILCYAEAALGLLELGEGDSAAAARRLRRAAQRAEELGVRDPSVIQLGGDLVEALTRCGRGDEAADALAAFERQAARTSRRWPKAVAQRGRGLLAADADIDAPFRAALALHAASDPFERARTELAYGERLRRARRKKEARAHLRAAHAAFTELGAAPWVRRAAAELRAAGAAAAAPADPPSASLTSQELEVALRVARGATTKEVAAALFLSPKTVENHLGRIYRKLGVRSRTELAALGANRNAALLAAPPSR